MTHPPSKLKTDALSLEPAERLDLIEALWDSLGSQPDNVAVPDWHLEEIRRRREAHQQSPVQAIPWPQMESMIRARRAQ